MLRGYYVSQCNSIDRLLLKLDYNSQKAPNNVAECDVQINQVSMKCEKFLHACYK